MDLVRFKQSLKNIFDEKLEEAIDREDKVEIEIYTQYLKELDEYSLPESSTSGDDPDMLILDSLQWLLAYGDIKLCYIEGKCWLPYLVSYNWCRNVTLLLVNLLDHTLACRKVRRETDYTSSDTSDVKYITSRHPNFTLLSKNYNDIYCDDSFLEGAYNIRVEDNTLYIDENKIECVFYVNGKKDDSFKDIYKQIMK